MLPLEPGIPEEKPETRAEELTIEEEEEAESEEESKEATEHPMEEQKYIFKVGEHEVSEEIIEGEEESFLVCLRCGVKAKISEADKLVSIQCRVEEPRPMDGSEKPKTCGYCGREAYNVYPVEKVDNTLIDIPLCNECIAKVEEFMMKSRPNILSISGKKRITCKHPMEGSRKVAWNHNISTWFIESEDGRWPCPACGYTTSRLLETIKHFVEKHPELPKTEREYVSGIGEVSKTWQGYYCPVCGLLNEDVKKLREHYKNHGGV